MADQRITTSYSSRYTFTGKEQDALTGLYYFGARYYDARSSLWYGVDMMAEKYPNISPYNYVANNPIIFKDPDVRYILPSDKAQQYSKLAGFLQNGIADLLKNKDVRSGLRLIGNFTDNQIDKLARYGEGITINLKQLDNDAKDHPAGLERNGDAWGFLGNINIDETLAQQLQDASTPEETSAALLGIASTILHESVHEGQNRYGEGNKDTKLDGSFSKFKSMDENRNLIENYRFNGNDIGSNVESGNAFENAIWDYGNRDNGFMMKQGNKGKIDQSKRVQFLIENARVEVIPKL